MDERWQPNQPPAGHKAPSANFFALDAPSRRLAFYYRAPWAKLNQLMVDAGCLRRRTTEVGEGSGIIKSPYQQLKKQMTTKLNATASASKQRRPSTGYSPSPVYLGADGWEVDVERTVAMLVLTAIHDIMKVEALLPTVSVEHSPYRGYVTGDMINDHDMALAYILETSALAATLPSYEAIPERQQRTICFTQAKIGFNHGWLVRAAGGDRPLHAA